MNNPKYSGIIQNDQEYSKILRNIPKYSGIFQNIPNFGYIPLEVLPNEIQFEDIILHIFFVCPSCMKTTFGNPFELICDDHDLYISFSLRKCVS